MRTPKVIPPLGQPKMSTLRLGKLMTMDEKFEVIGKLYKGYIGDLVRLMEAIEPMTDVKAAKAAMIASGGPHWLEHLDTMEMLESKIELLFKTETYGAETVHV